jgi:uncharacterized damage-inducible protein DinB
MRAPALAPAWPEQAPRLDAGAGRMPVSALLVPLADLAAVVGGIDDGTYVARTFAPVSGSIGEHVRHILDHIAAFASASVSEVLSYDHRERGTAVEQDRRAALRRIADLTATLTAQPPDLRTPVLVRTLVSRDQEVTCASTLGRELAFVISHTIHHQAIVGLLLAARHEHVPTGFGLAPSTPLPARDAGCAR